MDVREVRLELLGLLDLAVDEVQRPEWDHLRAVKYIGGIRAGAEAEQFHGFEAAAMLLEALAHGIKCDKDGFVFAVLKRDMNLTSFHYWDEPPVTVNNKSIGVSVSLHKY